MLVHLFRRYIFLFIVFLWFSPNVGAVGADQGITVLLRSIGHQFLLERGDSITPVLPLTIVDGRYSMPFETAFSYEPDMLTIAAMKVMELHSIGGSLIIEVQACEKEEVLHSFKASLADGGSMLPCSGRVLPRGCYVFYFTPIGITGITQPAGLADSPGLGYGYALIGLLLAAAVALYLIRMKRSAGTGQGLIAIGQYRFDQKAMLLMREAESVALSGKESELLYLLCSNESKTLGRDHILSVVWGDAGDYVGRTLDVFISKLRKKLEDDAAVKIINVRGVGYRFVVHAGS